MFAAKKKGFDFIYNRLIAEVGPHKVMNNKSEKRSLDNLES